MKGRLLDNQLDNNDKLAESLLMKTNRILSALLSKNILVTRLIKRINKKNPTILPCEDHTETYVNLLKAIEVLMYIEENTAKLDALPDKDVVKVTLLAIKVEIIKLLSIEVQSKKYPTKISEFDYDVILINYSDQAILISEVDIDLIRDHYAHYQQNPILIKCGDKIFCYGIVDEEVDEKWVPTEKITELDASKFDNITFPTEKNSPVFLSKKHISEEGQKELTKAHEVYTDYIYNKTVNHQLFSFRNVCLSDDVTEMLLLGFLRIIESLSESDKNTKFVMYVLQLIRNSRHTWLKSIDNSYALHVRKSQGGTEYPSTNKNTWLGLIKILQYVFKNEEIKNSEMGKLFTAYLQSLRRERNLFLLNDKLNDKNNKDAIKGVIRNKNGIYSLEQFQYLPDKKLTPQGEASFIMKELVEMLIDNLHNFRYKGTKCLPKLEYVTGLDNKKECIMYFPIDDTNHDKKNKKEKYKEYNISKLLKSQPLAHEINLSPKLCRYALTAMLGCHLYIAFSATKDTIRQQIKNNQIPANSCVIACEIINKKSSRKKVLINQIYYINYDKKIELLENEITLTSSPRNNEQSLFKEITHRIEDSEWLKDKLVDNTLLKIDTSKNEDEKRMFNSIAEILSIHRLLSLHVLTVVAASNQYLTTMYDNVLYRSLPHEDAAAITLYTTSYYKIIQPILRNFGIISKGFFEYNPSDPNPFLLKYTTKLGKNIENNPLALFYFMSDVLLYNYFISHGLSKIIQENQKITLKQIRSDFNFENCHLYVISNEEGIEHCVNNNKGHGIILYRQAKEKKISLRYCIDNEMTKKIMDIDLVVTIDDEQFLKHFSTKNQPDYYKKLIELTSIDREKGGLVLPTTTAEKKLVNKFIHYGMWYCKINILDKKVYRGDLENFFINLIRPELIKKIPVDGLFFSSANEYCSTSLGVCQGFLSQDGWKVCTVIHLPKSFISCIMDVSDVKNEVEVLYGPNTRLIYYKVEKNASLRNIIYHAILTDYDFNINDPKWKDLVNAQLKSELYTSVEFAKNNLKSNIKKIPELFMEIVNSPHQIPVDQLERIKPYFMSKKYKASVQLSCINGTPVEIVCETNVNIPLITQVKNYIKENKIENTYILMPIEKGFQAISFRLYYIKDYESIIEVQINEYAKQEFVAVRDDLNSLLTSSIHKTKRVLAREVLKPESLVHLDTLLCEKNHSSLPLIIGVNEDYKKEKKRFSSQKNFSSRMNSVNIPLQQLKTLYSTNVNSIHHTHNNNYKTKEKLDSLANLLIQINHQQEELNLYEKELSSIRAEDASHSPSEDQLIYGKFHLMQKEGLINTVNECITLIKKMEKNNTKSLSMNYHHNLHLLKSINKWLEEDNKTQIFEKIQKHLKDTSPLLLSIVENTKLNLSHSFSNMLEVGMLFHVFSKIMELYPLEAKKLIREIPSAGSLQEFFKDINEIIPNNMGYSFNLSKPKQSDISINYTLLKTVTELHKNYMNEYSYTAEMEDVKKIKKIIDFVKQPLTEIDKKLIIENYQELIHIMTCYANDKEFILTTQKSDFRRLLEACKQLFDTIIPVKHFVNLTLNNASKRTKLKNLNPQNSVLMGKKKNTLHDQKVLSAPELPSLDNILSPITYSNSTSNNSQNDALSHVSSSPELSSSSSLKKQSIFAELPKQSYTIDDLSVLLIQAIHNKNVNDVIKFLIEANQMSGLTQVLKSFDTEGQTPLHAALIQLQTNLQDEEVLQKLPEAIILNKLLIAHAETKLVITGAYHKNKEGLSPLQLAMKIDEREILANFLVTENKKIVKNAVNNANFLYANNFKGNVAIN